MLDAQQTAEISRLIDATRNYRAAQGLAGVNDVAARFVLHAQRTANEQGAAYASGVLNGVKVMLTQFSKGVVDPNVAAAVEVAWGIIGTVGPHDKDVTNVIEGFKAAAKTEGEK